MSSKSSKLYDPIVDQETSIPRILFVHSNPLVEGLALLDYLEEENIIRRCCYESKISIRFCSQVGTVKALSSSLIHGANIIHYSGHGDRDAIVLEKDNGDIHYLDSKALESLLKASDTGCLCSVAFVSACYSEEAGKRFVAAGVKHVICVKQNEMISDNSSLTFAKLFYMALFQGKSVQIAFDIALRTVIADESISYRPNTVTSPRNRISLTSEPKYLLLPLDDSHDEIIFYPSTLRQGSLIDETKLHTVNRCDKPPSKFVSRNIEMQTAFNYLCASRPRSRFVTIEGDHGVGKTAFVCQLSQYIAERSMYDEICFLPLYRMQRDYEINTHSGDISSQVSYLITRFALAAGLNSEEIESIDDLIHDLDPTATASDTGLISAYRNNSSNNIHNINHRNSFSTTTGTATTATTTAVAVAAATNNNSNIISRVELSRNSSYESIDPLSPILSDNSTKSLPLLPTSQTIAPTRRIFYVLDGCDHFLSTSINHTSHTSHGDQISISDHVNDDSISDLSDSDSGSITTVASNNTNHNTNTNMSALFIIIDTILRRTNHISFLLTHRRRSSRRRILSPQLSEPEKVIVLKPFTDTKMAELVRKVSPRPLTFTELGMHPNPSSNGIGTMNVNMNANEILSRQPWMAELKGNPRAAIYFVRHLSDNQLNDSDVDMNIALAKKAYEDAIHYRQISISYETTSISSSRKNKDRFPSFSDTSMLFGSNGIHGMNTIGSHSNINSSYNSNGNMSSYNSNSGLFTPGSPPNTSSFDLSLNNLSSSTNNSITTNNITTNGIIHSSLTISPNRYITNSDNTSNSIPNIIMLSDPSSWRLWIDSLAENFFSNIFSNIEISSRSSDLTLRLSRQLSEEDRVYLYSVFLARAAASASNSLSSPTSMKNIAQNNNNSNNSNNNSSNNSSTTNSSSIKGQITATVRLSTTITSPSTPPITTTQRLSYQTAQYSYSQWWEPIKNTLRKFRNEFMCIYPIILYGFCSRLKAEQLLVEENKPGLFLIRFSESKNDGSLVLTSLLPIPSTSTAPNSLLNSQGSSRNSSKANIHSGFDDLGCLDSSRSSNLIPDQNLTSSQSVGVNGSSSNSNNNNNLRIYHHLLQVSEYGVSISFRDHRSTYSSLKHLFEGCEALKVLYPDILKSDLLLLLDQINHSINYPVN